ncbi:MAG: hypothetical protein NC305_08685 [Lachnospiraceae bacterium]|nr:hypothetical protein [Butyrivibrio sp.]MCM1343528.1 hypothetical protein [Muribaculaceae bacterium]MCM1410609.1 hypothetical protein [Lachnospiraceae bacterium]
MKKKIKENAYEIIVALTCVAVFCFFVSCKQGYHMDELLSFELANAEFNPWIVPTQPEGRLARFVHNEIDGETFGETMGNLAETVKDVLENRGNSKLLTYTADVYEEPVWITSEQFQDYITVGPEDAFNYLSVYFNVKDDNHPPLHFMLLHTVSSLFQGRISPWMGCAINIAAVLWVMALLYRICRMAAPRLGLEKEGRRLGLMTALFYGLSTGALVTVLLIRMYGVLTLWCVLSFYLILKKWQDASFDRKNGRLILVTMLGFWTQYYFLFYCLLLAAVASVYLGKSGRRRELFCFVRSMVAAALVGLLAFPFAIGDVFSSGRGVEALGNLSQGLSGYGTRLLAFGRILLDRGIGYYSLCLVILLAAVLWAGARSRRKDRALQNGAGSNRQAASVRKAGQAGETELTKRAFWWMLLLPPAGYFLLAARMSPYLVDRYIMPLFPFAALILMFAIFKFLGQIYEIYPKKLTRKLTITVCEILIVFQVYYLARYDGSYLYQGYDLQRRCTGAYAEHPCICVYDGVGYYENLLEFTRYDRTLLLTLDELENRTDRESIAELDEVVLLVKGGVDVREVLSILGEEYGFYGGEMMMRDPGVYGDEILVMRKDVGE